MSGIHVNFTDDEAASEARSPEGLPTGEYPVAITECETRFVKSEGKNKGKPFYNIQMTVQEGHEYANRKQYASVMLFDGALYALSQLMKSIGLTPGQHDVPSAEDLLGKKFIVVVVKSQNKYKMDQQRRETGSTEVIWQSESKGFKPLEGAVSSSGTNAGKVSSSSGGGGNNDMLP